MCLLCQSNTFPFSEQSNSDISRINSGFTNILFPKDNKTFPDENLNSFLTILTNPFNNSDHPVSIDSKYYDIKYFNSLI